MSFWSRLVNVARPANCAAKLFGGLQVTRKGIEREQPVREKTDGATRKAMEAGGEQARDKDDQETEGNLRRDEALAGMWIVAAINHACRPDRGGAERGSETQQNDNDQSERDAEQENAPIRREATRAGLSGVLIRLTMNGVAAGFALGLASVPYLEALLYQVNAIQRTLLAIPALTIPTAALFSALPVVIRALHIEPSRMLRAE
jgi:hypothetical protein